MTYSKQQARHNLIEAIRKIDEYFAEIIAIDRATKGKSIAELYAAIKRRDKREPGRREKEEAEERITRILKRAFRKQKEQVQRWMETTYFERAEKRLPEFPDIDFEDDEYQDLIDEMLKAAKGGVNLFGTGQAIIDYTLTNKEAARWAREYVYDLVKGINSTTRDVLRDAVGAFVDTPGMTIGDVMRQLPFDEERAQRVAVTEITRAYAEGEMIAGRELQKEFPGVRIVKIWFTNNDDLVCDICGPLDGVEIELSEKWEGDLDQPPAHVNCRCWMETTTALAEL
jgi:hypothetical protein